eukprot:9562-Heterococcus_DN1.PRE.2
MGAFNPFTVAVQCTQAAAVAVAVQIAVLLHSVNFDVPPALLRECYACCCCYTARDESMHA